MIWLGRKHKPKEAKYILCKLISFISIEKNFVAPAPIFFLLTAFFSLVLSHPTEKANPFILKIGLVGSE